MFELCWLLLLTCSFISWYLRFWRAQVGAKLWVHVCCSVIGVVCMCYLLFNLGSLNYELVISSWIVSFLLKFYIKRKLGTTPSISEHIPQDAEIMTYDDIVGNFSKALFLFNNGITGNKFELHRLMKQQEYFQEFNKLVDTTEASLKSINYPDPQAEFDFVTSLVNLTYTLETLTSDFLFQKDEQVVLEQYYKMFEILQSFEFVSLIMGLSSEELLQLEAKNSTQETILSAMKQGLDTIEL